MAQQPKNNIGNVMIITPKRERTKKTTHTFIRLDNSVSEEGNSVKKLLTNYWGSAADAAYKTFVLEDEITKYCPSDAASGYGMMIFKVETADIEAKNVENIKTEAFNEDDLTEKQGNTAFRFVLEGKYLWRQDGSEFSADGFGHIRDDAGAVTHILATFGQEDRDGGTWYYLILRAANTKNGKINIIDDFTGGGGDPPGSGTTIPPTLP